jgi:hypothetical protein
MNNPCDDCNNMGARCPNDAGCNAFANYLDEEILTKSSNTCSNCEYGDYDKMYKNEVCCYIVDGDPLRLSGGMRWFVQVMGCGRWQKVSEGNPRTYNPNKR